MAERTSITNGGGGADKGTPVNPNVLKTLFIGEVSFGGYTYSQGDNQITAGSTTLVTKSIFGTLPGVSGQSGINVFIPVTKTGDGGIQTTEQVQSVFLKTQVKRIKLPEATFGLAIANKDNYTTKDSVGKAKVADDRFKDYTELSGIIASTAKEVKTIKNMLVNHATSIGVINRAYDPIDLTHDQIKTYWATEIAGRLEELSNKSSLLALTQPGQIFEGFNVFEKTNDYGTQYELRKI